jgi:hypothetical protein
LASLRYLVGNDVISKETYGSWLRDYLEIAIYAERDEADKRRLVTGILCDIIHTANPDYLPLARTAYEKGLVDVFMICLENVEESLNSRETPFENMRFPKRDFSNADVLASWAWFQEDSGREYNFDDDDGDWEDDDEDYEDDDEWIFANNFVSPAQREIMQRLASDMFPSLVAMDKGSTIESKLEAIAGDLGASDKKVGRNDPCPCGSGRKYKMCCGKKK